MLVQAVEILLGSDCAGRIGIDHPVMFPVALAEYVAEVCFRTVTVTTNEKGPRRKETARAS